MGENNNPSGTVIHVRTLFTRELRAAGTHTEIWDGTDDKGALATPGYDFMPTIWAWNIADNGIIIFGDRPEITNVSAEPNYFSPAYNPYGLMPTQKTTVSFSLSKVSSVEVNIANSDGILVRTMDKANLPPGANSIIWDGKDMSGNLVRDGSYRITLTAVDSTGNRSLSRSALVMVYY